MKTVERNSFPRSEVALRIGAIRGDPICEKLLAYWISLRQSMSPLDRAIAGQNQILSAPMWHHLVHLQRPKLLPHDRSIWCTTGRRDCTSSWIGLRSWPDRSTLRQA
jgi:hypothetical protein